MISTEERVRAATRAAADTVPPGSAPPLRLPPDPVPRFWRRRRPRRGRSWLRAMTPLAAAAAVVAAIATGLAVTHSLHGPAGPPPKGAATDVQVSGLPAYYVALADPVATPQRAVIRATRTGKVLSTVTPPRPYRGFMFVTGAADDRTFVLAAQRWWDTTSGPGGPAAQNRDNTTPVAFFRLRFDPATRTVRLTRLSHLAGPQASQLAGIALSPDGTRLAAALHSARIAVFTLATGSARYWVWPGAVSSPGTWVGNDKPDGEPLSWTADGRILAFQFWTESGGVTQVRLLDTASPGGSLRGARAAVTFVGHGQVKTGPIGNSIITPDGTKIVTAASRTRGGRFEVMEFSVPTGQPIIPPPAGNPPALVPWNVLWTDSSGRTLIVEATVRSTAASVLGLLRGGRFTPLPGAPVNANNVAW
jgi:hypothetical protein